MGIGKQIHKNQHYTMNKQSLKYKLSNEMGMRGNNYRRLHNFCQSNLLGKYYQLVLVALVKYK